MKILQIIDLYKTGGAEKIFDLFGKYCAVRGYQNERIVLYGDKTHKKNRCIIKNEHTSLIKKIIDQVYCVTVLWNIVRKINAAQIVSFLDRSNLVTIFSVLFMKNRPNITITVHNPPDIQYRKINKYVRSVFIPLLAWSYNRKWLKVIAVSEHVKYSLESIGVKKVFVVHNPVPKNSGAWMNIEKTDAPFLIAVGRLEYQKAHWKMIRAFYFYRQKYQDFELKLYIFGDGGLGEALKQMCVENGLSNSIFFCGYSKDIKKFIANSEGMIFSSLFEGFPVSLVECMSLKKPFIGSDTSIPVEIRRQIDGKNIANTYKTKTTKVDFSMDNIDYEELELAYLIHKIRTDTVFCKAIADTGHSWIYNNCSVSNFDEYII